MANKMVLGLEKARLLREALTHAFSGKSGYLPSLDGVPKLHDIYRAKFLEINNWNVHTTGGENPWLHWYDHFIKVMYGSGEAPQPPGPANSIKRKLEGAITEWEVIFTLLNTISLTMITIGSGKEEVENRIEKALEVFKEIPALRNRMQANETAFNEVLEELNTAIGSVTWATDQICQAWESKGRILATSYLRYLEGDSIFATLRKVSEFADVCTNSISLLPMIKERGQEICDEIHFFGRLKDQLQRLRNLCLDLYANFSTGSTEELQADFLEMSKYGRTFQEVLWKWSKPWPSVQDFTLKQKPRCGFVSNNYLSGRSWRGDDAKQVLVERDELIQFGLSRMDFEKGNESSRREIVTNLIDKPKSADKAWGHAPLSNVQMWSSELSWIQIPVEIASKVLFDTTSVSASGRFEGLKHVYDMNAEAWGGRKPSATAFKPSGSDCMRTDWYIDFRQPFQTDDIQVTVWFHDVSLSSVVSSDLAQHSDTNMSLAVYPTDVSRGGFRMNVDCSSAGARFKKVKIAYAVVQKPHLLKNFMIRDGYDLSIPAKDVPKKAGQQDHNFSSMFSGFYSECFKQTPSVAILMNSIAFRKLANYRVYVRFAVGKNGVLTQAYSWGDTVLQSVRYAIMAVGND